METSSGRIASLERTLRASHLFAGVDEHMSDFARIAIRRQFHQVIASGLVTICQPNRDGESAIVALYGRRESIGDIAVISTGRYPAGEQCEQWVWGGAKVDIVRGMRMGGSRI